MEAMIYEDSPLASYLEGQGTASDHEIHIVPQPNTPHNHIAQEEEDRKPHDGGGGGGGDDDDDDDDGHVHGNHHIENDDTNQIDFAPSGHININDKIHSKMPKPIHLKPFVQYPSLSVILETCKSSLTVNLGEEDNKRFLEQIGYKIVASQLLNEEQSPPTFATASSLLANTTITPSSSAAPAHTNAATSTAATSRIHHDLSESRAAMLSVRGAILAPATSFFLVWLLHWAVPSQQAKSSYPLSPTTSSSFSFSSSTSSSSSSSSQQSPPTQSTLPYSIVRISIALLLFAGITYELYSLSRRHWLRHLRRYVIEVTGGLVGNSQSFDSAASAALAVIQEVELVSRGYKLSHPLPPVSRIEENSPTKHCLRLRRALSRSLVQLLERYLESKQKLTPLSNPNDLEKYYEIYDFSTEELHEAESVLAEEDDAKTSLRSLRVLFAKLYAARKGLLCCLLAIPAKGREEDIPVWGVAADELQALTEKTSLCLMDLTDVLNEQNGDWPLTSQVATQPVDSTRTRNRVQLRKLNSLSQGIRGIHAKMNLIREECECCLDGTTHGGNETDIDFTTTLLTMYDSIGTDLRCLIQEWEAGRHALQLAFGSSSSGCSSPITTTAVAAIAAGHAGHAHAHGHAHGHGHGGSSSSSSTANTSDCFFFRRSSASRPPSGKWACLPGSPVPSTLSGTTAIDTSVNGFLISANHSSNNSIDQQVMSQDGPENASGVSSGGGGGGGGGNEEEGIGSFKSPDPYLDDEEVYEAIAAPITGASRRRTSIRMSMSREERIAKMKEDRARQTAARERQDMNTSMLRELETVIKLKPRGSGIHRKGRTSI